MHVSLDSALGRQRRLNSVGESVLQIAPSAAAAYSLRSLTGGDPEVVNVRRSSDNVEKKFTASGISSGALLDFVKTEAVTYTSDFSTDTDGWSVNNGALAVSGGALELTPNSASTTHHTSKSGQVAAGTKARISFDVKIPSGQSLVTGFKFVEISGTAIKTVANQTQGDFVSYSEEFTSTNAGILRFFANKDGNITFAGDDSEKLIIKNIVVTSIDENGFVETWYDQSGNSRDSINTTAAQQPIIVEAGVFQDGLKFTHTDTTNGKRLFVPRTAAELGQAFALVYVGKVTESDTSYNNLLGGTRGVQGYAAGTAGISIKSSNGTIAFINETATDARVTSASSTATTLNEDFVAFATYEDAGAGPELTFQVDAGNQFFSFGSAYVTTSTKDIGIMNATAGTTSGYRTQESPTGICREVLVYSSHQGDNRAALVDNINSQYNLF